MAEKVGEIYYDVTLELDQMIKDQRRAQQQLDKTTSSLNGFEAKLTQVASAVAALASASYLIAQMDSYTKLSAQLKLATDSTAEFTTAMAQVKQIAQESQTDLSGVAVLYARITSATKELGTSQTQVAAITRAVALSLKVSGAGANESASATLQLSQAFATGALRGEEFNAVNEAAPRLMKALADGIGVPVGQLREMAAAGKLTSEVMANALPRALKELEQEAKSVQTIDGAFQQLRNEATLFIGEQASANGVVKVLTGSIGLLANNLTLLAGIMGTVVAVKMATWLLDFAKQAIAAVGANRAMAASSLATAQANVAATAATVSLTTARVAELRQSVLSAQGASILAVATNGLIPAQVAAKAATDAHSAALVTLSAAQKAASVTSGLARGVLGLLGGPIGLVTTLLGLGVTAWSLWGNSAKDESAKAAVEVEASGREIIASLEKQNAKLRERLALAKAGNVEAAKSGGKNEEKLGSLLKEINSLKAKGNALTGVEQIQLIELEGEYRDISAALESNRKLTGEIGRIGQESKAGEWAKKYATDLEQANTEIAKAKKELGAAFTPELEQRIRQKFIPDKKPVKTAAERFDGNGYLLGLQASAAASDWAKIDADERKALSDQKKLLDERKLSQQQHEEGVLLIQRKYANERLKLQDGLDQLIGGKDAEAKEKARQASEDMERQAVELGRALEDSVRTPLERLNAELLRYDSLLAAGVITQQTHARASVEAKKEYEGSLKQMDQFTVRFAESVQDQLGDTLYDSLTGDFDNIGKAWGQMLMRMMAQAAAANLSRSLFGSMVSGGTGSGALGSLMGGALGSLGDTMGMSIGGTYGSGTQAGLDSLVGSLAGRANGGGVSAGGMYQVNERDTPELLTVGNKQLLMMAGQSGNVTPLDTGRVNVAAVPTPSTGGGGGYKDLKVEIVNSGQPAKVERAQMTRNDSGQDVLRVFVKEAAAEVADQMASGRGPVHQAMLSRQRMGR